MITDLRQLNSFIDTPSYRNEDIRDAVHLVKGNDKFVTLDIKDGFHHVPVASEYRDYLAFRWKGTLYRWTVLPFSLSCSPYYFNKCVRPVVEYLRCMGLRITVYVDDFLLAVEPNRATDY